MQCGHMFGIFEFLNWTKKPPRFVDTGQTKNAPI